MPKAIKRLLWLSLAATAVGVIVCVFASRYQARPGRGLPPPTLAQIAPNGIYSILSGLASPSPDARQSALDRLEDPKLAPSVENALARKDLTPQQREALETYMRVLPRRQQADTYRKRVQQEDEHLMSSTRRLYTKNPKPRRAIGMLPLLTYWSVANFDGRDRQSVREDLYNCVDRIAETGWDEPLFSYIRATTLAQRGTPKEVLHPLFQKAVTQLQGSPYPALWRCWAAFDCARYSDASDAGSEAGKKEGHRLMEEGMNLLPAALADANSDRTALVATMRKIAACSRNVLGDHMQLCERVWPMLEEHCRDRSTILTARALVYKDSEWGNTDSASGSPPAPARSAKSPALATAEQLLEEAWAADASNDIAAYEMETLVARRGGKPEELEKWFGRAMATNPDCYQACLVKLEYLKAMWPNDPSRILAFGQECLQGGNWQGRIPLVLMDAHMLASQCTPHGWDPGAIGDYFTQHPEVCDQIETLHKTAQRRGLLTRRHAILYRSIEAMAGRWSKIPVQSVTPTFGEQLPSACYLPPGLFEVLQDEAGRRSQLNQP